MGTLAYQQLAAGDAEDPAKAKKAPVYLNVYDLTGFNSYTYWFGLGLFHSGVEVHGVEYGFGYHELPTSGVFEVEPRQCPGFTFRTSIELGSTDMGPLQARRFLEEAAAEYSGNSYDLLLKNCNHFTEDMSRRLTGRSIPGWVNRLARIGWMCRCVLPALFPDASVEELEHHEESAEGKEIVEAAEVEAEVPSTASDEDEQRLWLLSPAFVDMDSAARWMPHVLATLAANLLHYGSLWRAERAAVRRVRARQRLLGPEEQHEPLTFELMSSPEMRQARYSIKLARYTITLVHLLVWCNDLDELHLDGFTSVLSTAQVVVGGLLAGVVTVYLDENRRLDLRTAWNPTRDFRSQELGLVWDALRLLGGVLAAPVEEELFYHSWLYRRLVVCLHLPGRSFKRVPLKGWRLWPTLGVNGFFAVRNGMEWRSRLFSGLIFHWIIVQRGHLLEGLAAHALCNAVIGIWVLCTGQRQYW